MTWSEKIREIEHRQELARAMGGPDKVARQHEIGRLTVRERIDALLDPGSFDEIGATSGTPEYHGTTLTGLSPTACVFGRGRIETRPVVVAGDDFTIRGGASEGLTLRKKVRASEQMANELRIPIIRLIEGTGGGGSVKTLDSTSRTYVPGTAGTAYDLFVSNLGTVPVVSLALGPVAGLGAARLVASHYSLMVREHSQVFIAGPAVVARLGQDLTKEELGGSKVHGSNGTVDDVVDTEAEAFERTRRFLSYLPQSVHELSPQVECTDPVDRADDWLISAIPEDRRKVYKIRPIIESVVDEGSFFEIGRRWGRSAVTGLARLNGRAVAVISNDPYFYGGGWSRDACEKVIRHIDLANTFHLPIVHLVDNPGFPIGLEHEIQSGIRYGTRALTAVYQSQVPWCTVILRKCFGVGGASHQNASRMSYRYAWPSAEWGSLPLEGGIEVAFRAELDAADDPEAARAEIFERMASVRSPLRTAEVFDIEDIIDPRATRFRLCEFAELTAKLPTPGTYTHTPRP